MSDNITIDKINEIMKINGVDATCISDKFIDNYQKLSWKCINDHIYEKSWNNIIRRSNCPKCTINKNCKYTLIDCNRVASERLGKCLSTEYSGKKLKWQCNNNHIWESTFSNIIGGTWCPKCRHQTYTGEEITRNIFETLFQDEFPKIRPKWLNTLELDGYNDNLKLAFEYDGEHHYFIVLKYKMTNDDLIKQQNADKEKNELCKINNVNLIRIPYFIKYDKLKNYITDKCKELSIKIPNDVDINYKSFKNIYKKNEQKYIQMKNFVENKGGILLSDTYINATDKVKVRCKCNYEWETDFHHLQNGRWCPKCSGNKKKTLQEVEKLAIDRGGICLETEYINYKTLMLFQCANEHLWLTSVSKIISGRWCPYCSK